MTDTPSTVPSAASPRFNLSTFSRAEQESLAKGLEEGFLFRIFCLFRDQSHETIVAILRRGLLQSNDVNLLVAEAEDRHVRVYDLIMAIVNTYKFQ